MSIQSQTAAYITVLILGTVSACRSGSDDPDVLRIGSTPVPHEAMLRHMMPELARAGIAVKLVVMQDYVQPNLRLVSRDLDANFFQTVAYFEDFKTRHGADLANAGSVHTEPFALYSKKYRSIAALPQGAKVAVPADASNQHRALMLLARAGAVSLRDEDGGTLQGTRDIAANPKRLRFVPVEAAMMPRMLEDVDLAGINANFALMAGMRPSQDALEIEDASEGPYANIVAVRTADVGAARVVRLMAALRSDTMRTFLAEQYQGAVAPTF